MKNCVLISYYFAVFRNIKAKEMTQQEDISSFEECEYSQAYSSKYVVNLKYYLNVLRG